MMMARLWTLVILFGCVGFGEAVLNVTSPVPNATYDNYNLTIAFRTAVGETMLNTTWTNLDTGQVFRLVFSDLDSNRSYVFELAPLAFGTYSNGTFLWRGNYSWAEYNISRFFVNTQCVNPTHNYTNECNRCVANFLSETPPCVDCIDGYYGEFCNQTELECSETRCHSYGICIGRLDGCSCDNDHFLEDCSLNRTACATQVCHDRGLCQPATNECLCQNPNYNASTGCASCRFNYDNTTNCTSCKTGFFDEHCVLNDVGCAFFRCGDRGRCSGQLEGCTCNLAYQGLECTESACTGAGVPSTNGSRCICDFPNHIDPYDPRHCTLICHPTQGVWIEGVCRCLPGFTGARCTAKAEPLSAWMVALTIVFVFSLTVLLVWIGMDVWHRVQWYRRRHSDGDDGL